MNLNERSLLHFLSSRREVSAKKLSDGTSLPYSTVMSLLNALSERKFVTLRKEEDLFVSATDEGRKFAESALPERRLVHAIGFNNSIGLDEAFSKAGLVDSEKGIALKWAKEKKLAEMAGGRVKCLS